MKKRAIDKYLEFCGGNQSQAARALGKKQGHIWYWLKPDNDLPLALIPKVSKIMNCQPKDLRPDFFT